ncbi:MAG: hypothetical protein IJL12_04645 [Selenomonadaceae bacterium]|nr:hypothetical protein [Selenomonadaceae bacterium]MBQ7493713.1 hypothetical protein [Selenomonadaceae bacterium]
MPKLTEKPKREKRLGLALTKTEWEDLSVLSKLTGKTAAVLAREILAEYLIARADVIQEARQADNAYQASLKDLRDKNSALLAEDE